MLGSNDQHKDTRGKSAGIYEISPNNELALRVAGLRRKLDSVLNMVPKVPQVEVCGICNVQGHSTHMCPAGNDYPAFIHEQAHMMNSYNQRPRNDPFSNTYNPGDEQNEKTTPKEAIPIGTSTISPQMHKAKNPYLPPIPFHGRLATSKHDKSFAEIYDILSKVNVNLPLLDMIGNMPTYAKFFKDINLMPYSVYVQLGLGELKSTTLGLQLADRSVKYPRGIVEDILVQVDKLILPADFVVLDMEDAPIHNRELPILLGRPFMATANTLIDVKNGILKMTVLGRP
ncbi:unnamed protein product [Prunus brigantina]